jgi:hypothetical protein
MVNARPNAWGHEIRVLPVEERDDLARRLRCVAPPRCGGLLVVECIYAYSTPIGPGTATRAQCEYHGRVFAELYGLTFPELPAAGGAA